MGRYNNVKVASFAKKVNINEIGPEFQFFDMITHREGNYVTMVSHEYYRPSYRTRFRRPGRKNIRNALDTDDCNQSEATETNPQISPATDLAELNSSQNN